MEPYLTQYQSANISDEQSIKNFVVRKKEFERVLSDIRRTDTESSFQHYVFVGRRGSGKSTLLRRIQAEVTMDKQLKKQFLVANLSEEQTGVYKLYDLWDYVIRNLQSQGYEAESPDWQEYADNMKAYSHKLYEIVREALIRNQKKLILLIDNIDRIFKNIGDDATLLREQLMNYNDVRIIGGSTIMSEDYWKYDMPFYQFFSIKKLKAITLTEIKALLSHWADEKELPEIGSFVEKHPGKIQVIRMLTDGTPRTMLLFVEMLINRPLQNGFDYLRKIIDQATPIYQERLTLLSGQQQKILTELSFFWEATAVEHLIQACKMPGKTISAQLNSLIKSRLVEKIKGPTKNNLYRLEERFFNLWLLMTQGGPKQKQDAKYLTIFLENWYDQAELKEVYNEFVGTIKTAKPSYAVSMTKALVHSRHISMEERDKLLSEIQSSDLSADLKSHLPKLSKAIFQKASAQIKEEKWEDAKKTLEAIEQESAFKFHTLGWIEWETGNEDQAEAYYLLAIEKGDTEATYDLASLYEEQNKLDQAETYYLKAIKKGHVNSLNDLAILYQEQNKPNQAETYYLKAIKNNIVPALHNLALLYMEQNQIDQAEAYFFKAIEKGHIESLNNLALTYKQQDKTNKAIKYFLKAIEKGDTTAQYNLANLYWKQGEIDKAEICYLKAIETGQTAAPNNLANLYKEQNKLDQAETYYRMAVSQGNVKAELNLAHLLYSQNKNSGEAQKLIRTYNKEGDHSGSQVLALISTIDLWSGNLLAYQSKRDLILKQLALEKSKYLHLYIRQLLIHKQKHYIIEQFETGPYSKQLKSSVLPLYYVALTLRNDLDPKLLKMPPELEESVQDILNSIEASQEFYYGKT